MMQEYIIKELLTLRDVTIFVIIITLVMFFFVTRKMKQLKIQGKKGKSLGLFVGLGGKSLLMLSVTWSKLTIFLGIIVLSQKITMTHFALIVYLTMFIIVLKPNLSMICTQFFSTALLTTGIIVANTLSSYLKQIKYDFGMQMAYWLLSILIAICAMSIFTREVTMISSERKYFNENGETE